ncbi:MAG: 2'-5' RNA ligase family protein [Armatimonadota bacterium]
MTKIRTIFIVAALCAAVLVLMGCEEKSYNAETIGKDAASTMSEDKTILAIQGFVDKDVSDKIMAICSEIKNVEGYDSYLGRSFIPHITLASWKVTPSEFKTAESQFNDKLKKMRRVQVSVTLGEKEKDGILSYYLIPETSKELLDFHKQVHENLDWHYEPFRKIDLPGSWTPHLTLFTIPNTQKPQITEALQKLSEIHSVRIERIGFLGLGPIWENTEVQLMP